MVDRNVVHGTVHGSVVQAQTVHGGVHIHAPELTVPQQLPHGAGQIVGRASELNEMTASAERVVVISGMAGVGKTALCLQWAREVAVGFPDGQLYVDLRGFDPAQPPVSTAEAVRGFLDGFGVPPERIRPDVAAQVNLYRSIVADRRVLVVLDNARDAEQVRPLLPAGRDCVVVITSRTELTGLLVDGGVRRVALGLLGESDARRLIADRAAGAAEDDAVGELAAMCAGLPLALAIIAAQAAQHRFPLQTLVRQLRSEGRLLDALDTGDVRTTARAAFSWSYETLSPGAQRLFRHLGLMTGADIAWPAMASLIGTRDRTALVELLRANLVEEYLPGRFRLHDLLREYSADLVVEESEQDRLAACTRMIDSYLHGALAADVALKAQRLRVTVPSAGPGVEVAAITDYLSGLDWFAEEYQLAVDAVDLAARLGLDRQAWQLAWALATYLRRFSHRSARERTQQQALISARRLGDRYAEAKACLMLGRTLLRQDRQYDAEGMFQSALRLFRELGGAAEEADVLTSIATLHLLRWQVEDAAAAARRALSLAETVHQLNCQAAALRIIGRCDLERGDHEQAVERCTAALELYRVTGDTEGEAAAQRWLGTAYRKLGRWDEAVRHYERSLEIDVDLGDDYYVAVVLDQLGLTYVAMGRQPDAESAWRRSVAILDYLDHPQADTVRARLIKNEGSRSGTERP